MSKLRLNLEGKIKLFLTLSLLIYSFFVAKMSNEITMLIAMSLATVGDICLMLYRGSLSEQKEDTFNFGVLAFGVSHIMYILGMPTQYSEKLFFVSLALGFVLAIIIRFAKNSKETYVCIPYSVIIILNAVNAWHFSLLAAFGMGLFIISDLMLIICKMQKKRNFACNVVIWLTYVLAQACMLTSVLIK